MPACTACWCTSAGAAAPWTAPVRAPRRPRGAALSGPQFGPPALPPADRGPRHPGASPLCGLPGASTSIPARRNDFAASRRARGRGCASGDPGEARCGLGITNPRSGLEDAETVLNGRDPSSRFWSQDGVTGRGPRLC